MTEEKARQRTSPIASLVTKECGIVEMIYRDEEHATLFACFHGGSVTECSTLDVPRHGHAWPYSPENNLLTHRVVLFPSRASEYESEEELVHEVKRFIHRYADLSESFEEAAI